MNFSRLEWVLSCNKLSRPTNPWSKSKSTIQSHLWKSTHSCSFDLMSLFVKGWLLWFWGFEWVEMKLLCVVWKKPKMTHNHSHELNSLQANRMSWLLFPIGQRNSTFVWFNTYEWMRNEWMGKWFWTMITWKQTISALCAMKRSSSPLFNLETIALIPLLIEWNNENK